LQQEREEQPETFFEDAEVDDQSSSQTRNASQEHPLVARMKPFMLPDIEEATTTDIGERHNRLVRYVIGGELVRERQVVAAESRWKKILSDMELRLNALQSQIYIVHENLDLKASDREIGAAGNSRN
jgi:hypothetical protein